MKPIAYIDHVSGKPKLIDGYVVQTDYDIPLYTTPQTKPLSDEEIDKFIEYATMQGYGSSYCEGLSDGIEWALGKVRGEK